MDLLPNSKGNLDAADLLVNSKGILHAPDGEDGEGAEDGTQMAGWQTVLKIMPGR